MTASRWQSRTLDGCATFLSGGTPFKGNAKFWTGSIPWISAKDLKVFRLYDAEDHVTPEAVAAGSRLVPAGSIFLLVRGMTLHKDVPICVAMREMAFNQDLKALLPKAGVDGPFLTYWLLAHKPVLLGSVDSAGHGTGRLNTDTLKEMQVLLPPLAEQKAIAGVLGALDDKIELNRQMNATLEAMARALFQSWFVDFDPVRAKLDGRQPVGLDPATAALFTGQLEDSPLGHIPKGWTAGKLGDIGTNTRRTVQPGGIAPNTPYIALEHMPRRCITLGDWDDAAEVASGKSAFKKGEILFGKLRPYFHKVGVAPFDGVCSTDILVLAPKSPEWFGVLLGHASSDELIQFTDLASTGTKMPRTNWADISSFKVVIPPTPVAAAFSRIVEPMIEQIQANIFQSRTLATLRDTLLPKLLSGELSVAGIEKQIAEVIDA